MSLPTAVNQSPALQRGWPDIRDRRRLGSSVWLLILLGAWKGPSDIYVRAGASIRAAELAEALGIGERQARRDLQRLRRAGYVELQNTGRGFRIHLSRTMSLPQGQVGRGEPQPWKASMRAQGRG